MTWCNASFAVMADTLISIKRDDRAMVRCICHVNAKDDVSLHYLLEKFTIQDVGAFSVMLHLETFCSVLVIGRQYAYKYVNVKVKNNIRM